MGTARCQRFVLRQAQPVRAENVIADTDFTRRSWYRGTSVCTTKSTWAPAAPTGGAGSRCRSRRRGPDGPSGRRLRPARRCARRSRGAGGPASRSRRWMLGRRRRQGHARAIPVRCGRPGGPELGPDSRQSRAVDATPKDQTAANMRSVSTRWRGCRSRRILAGPSPP
jgi:hypothetical protein